MIGRDGRARNGLQIPGNLRVKYKDSGWNGFADWLGKSKRPAFLPYEEAKKVVNALRIEE